MEEKLRFVFEYERDEQTMTELCESFGIARGKRAMSGCGVTVSWASPDW